MQINSTQAMGLAAFGSAALLAAAAFGATRKGRGTWALVALAQASFALEVMAGWRHRASLAVGAWLRAGGLYPERRPAQVVMLVVLVVLALLVARMSSRRRRPAAGRAAPALAATAALLFLFAVELISLHAVDAVLYRQVQGVAVVGWLWLAGGLTVALGAWRALRR